MDKKNLDFKEFDSVSKAEWKEKVIADLRGKAFEEITWADENGNQIQPFYTSEDTLEPGSTFSIQDREQAFQIRSEFGGDNAKDVNELILEGLMQGCNNIGLSTEINSLEDLRTILKDVDLTAIALNVLNKEHMVDTALLLIEYCEQNDIETNDLIGGLQYDPLTSYLFTKEEPGGWKDRVSQLAQISKYRFKDFKVIDVNVNHIYNSGGNTITELATAISMAHEYLVLLLDKGFTAKESATMIRFTMNTGSSYFNEIAKFRALRSLWKQVLEQYIEEGEKLPEIFIHAETNFWNMSTMDMHNNLLRATTAASSAILGGVNSLRVLPYNMPLIEDRNESIRLSYNIQSILIEESYLAKVNDPGKGSYYIETLTNDLSKSSWEMFQEMENLGGFCKSVELGFIYSNIAKTKKAQEDAFEAGEKVAVGVNKYPNKDEHPKMNRTKSIHGDGLSISRLTEKKEMEHLKENIKL